MHSPLRVLACVTWLAAAFAVTPAVEAQKAPTSLGALWDRVERERSLPARKRAAAIRHFARFKSPGARKRLLQLLDEDKDTPVLAAVMVQLRPHTHATVLAALQRAFDDARNRDDLEILKGAATGLSGQKPAGVDLLVAELRKPRSETHLHATVHGLRTAGAKGSGPVLTALRKLLVDERYDKSTVLLNEIAWGIATRGTTAVDFLLRTFAATTSTNVRRATLYGLRSVKGNDHAVLAGLAPSLRDKRFDGDAATLNAVAHAIAVRRNGGLQALLEVLRKPRSDAHHAAAVTALRYVKNKKAAFAELERAFETAEPDGHYPILSALRSFPKEPNRPRLLVAALDSPASRARSEAIYQLAMLDHPKARPAALKQAQDEETLKVPTRRAELAYVLARQPKGNDIATILDLARGAERPMATRIAALKRDKNKKVYPRFVQQLAVAANGSGPEEDSRTATALLASCTGKAADRALLTATRAKSTGTVITAVKALVERRNKRVVSTLEKLLTSSDENLRVEAMLGLHALRPGSAAWARQLMELMLDAGGATGFLAVEMLADIGHAPALPAVLKLVDHEAWQVRSVAFRFCRKVRGIASVPLLIARLPHETGRLRHEAFLALRELTHRTYRKAEQWQQWWDASGATFKLPPAAPAKNSAAGRPVAAAMTYYRLPMFSDRVCFLVDSSGSMAQKVGTAKITKLEAAKQALRGILDKCKPSFRFNIVHFAGTAKSWSPELGFADDANKRAARKFVGRLRPSGATNVYDALKTAFEDEKVDTIYLLSDGAPSAGAITAVGPLADEVRSWNALRRIIIHTISIGADSPLMKRLAAESGGEYVRRR